MIRGKIVIVLNEDIMWTSTEFNGGMGYEGFGEEIFSELEKINSLNEYKELVENFNKKYFNYNENLFYNMDGVEYEKALNMSVDYYDNWFSDYLYIKNISDETILFIDKNKVECELEPNKIGVFYYGEIAKDIKQNELNTVMSDLEKYIKSLVSNDNIDIIDMYNNCLELDNTFIDGVYTKEMLIDVMYEHAKNGDTFSAMARDIDDNSGCELFEFDYSCWGQGCTPIEDKEELAEFLLHGSL